MGNVVKFYSKHVIAVITIDLTNTTQPAIERLTDYYPFGMEEPGRSYNSNTSRFGYTGHEKESDLAEGVYTTQYRLLDTRLGRWMSVDPLFAKYPDMSAYNYCGGNPVNSLDPNGAFQVKEIPTNLNDTQKKGLERFLKIVQNIGNLLKTPDGSWNEENLNTLHEITGLSIDKIKKHMEYGKGPIINFIENNGTIEANRYSHTIDVSTNVLQDLGEIKENDTKIDLRDETVLYKILPYKILSCAMLIYHEYGHWGDHETNKKSYNGGYIYRSTGQILMDDDTDPAEGVQHDKKSRTGHRGSDVTIYLFKLESMYSDDEGGVVLYPMYFNGIEWKMKTLPKYKKDIEYLKDDMILKILNIAE